MNERRDVMGWTEGCERIDVTALGGRRFDVYLDGEGVGMMRLNTEAKRLEQAPAFIMPLTDSRVAALTLLDRRVTQAQAGEVTQ